jgi:hypothetical protein
MKNLTLILFISLFIGYGFSQPCNCDMTAVGGTCDQAPNCGIPTRTACIAAGGTWLFQVDCPQALPVEIADFSIEYIDNKVNLLWTTYSERDNDYFTIESSKDAYYWEELGTVKASGNSSSEVNYVFLDKYPFIGKSYYKVSQTDFNGVTNEAFKIVSDLKSTKYLLYPVPVNKSMFVEGDNLQNSTISVINSIGENIFLEGQFFGDKLSYDFSEIPNGVYFLVIENQNTKNTERIVVAHKQ